MMIIFYFVFSMVLSELGFLFILLFFFMFFLKSLCFFLTIGPLFGLDMVGLVMGALVVVVFLMVCLSGCFDYFKKNFWFEFLALSVVFVVFLLLLFFTFNYFIFFLFFEVAVVPIFVLVIGWGYSANRTQSALYMFLYTFFFSLPFLLLLLFYYLSGLSLLFLYFFFNLTFSGFFGILWFCMLLVFMVSLPVFFLHLWLPSAHVEAPLLGSMVLAGVLLKLGGYGIFKSIPYVLDEFLFLAPWFLSFSFWGGIIIGLVCLRQVDMKSLIAYSSVVHMGPVFGAIFLLSFSGFLGGYLMMFSHGLCSSCLFFLLNLCYQFFGSRSFLLNRGGLFVSSFFSFIWFFFCIFNMGFPPSFNFFSELFIVMGVFSFGFTMAFFIFSLMLVSGFYSVMMYLLYNHGVLSNFLFNFFMSLKDLLNSFISFSGLTFFIGFAFYVLC